MQTISAEEVMMNLLQSIEAKLSTVEERMNKHEATVTAEHGIDRSKDEDPSHLKGKIQSIIPTKEKSQNFFKL